MANTKNRAVIYYQGQSFIIWQDDKDNWVFNYNNLNGVNTQSKDLQTALNIVYENIRDDLSRHDPQKFVKKKTYRRNMAT